MAAAAANSRELGLPPLVVAAKQRWNAEARELAIARIVSGSSSRGRRWWGRRCIWGPFLLW